MTKPVRNGGSSHVKSRTNVPLFYCPNGGGASVLFVCQSCANGGFRSFRDAKRANVAVFKLKTLTIVILFQFALPTFCSQESPKGLRF
jgi:hypothetical protein